MATADEIVSQSEKLGAKFNKRTLYNYTASKCIPEPKRGAGYGGKWVEYNKIDIIWAVVTWRMIHGVYPECDDPNDIIASIKPPKTPPQTISVLHNEFIRLSKELLRNEPSKVIIKDYILENCWKQRKREHVPSMILSGMMMWYVYSFLNAVFDLVSLEVNIKNDGNFNEKYERAIINKLIEINQYIKELSIE